MGEFMTATTSMRPRLAVRGVIVHEDRLLLVNAWPGNQSDLWCAPGGGVEVGQSLPENLKREIWEETGLGVAVGEMCLVNEFHAPERQFHQVEIFFRCQITSGDPGADWQDTEGVVHSKRLLTQAEVAELFVRPKSLGGIAWNTGVYYDPLERLVK